MWAAHTPPGGFPPPPQLADGSDSSEVKARAALKRALAAELWHVVEAVAAAETAWRTATTRTVTLREGREERCEPGSGSEG